MKSLNRKLFTVLGLSWLSFGVVGIVIFLAFPTPHITLLIERSYCQPQQWQKLIEAYTQLYQKHQNQELQIQEVVLFNDLGQEVLTSLPSPETLRSLNTYGRSSAEKQKQLRANYAQTQVLTCPSP